jgi:hypothetical protein
MLFLGLKLTDRKLLFLAVIWGHINHRVLFGINITIGWSWNYLALKVLELVLLGLDIIGLELEVELLNVGLIVPLLLLAHHPELLP